MVVDSKPANDDRNSATDLCLVPGCVKEHTFSFLPKSEDVGKNLEVLAKNFRKRKVPPNCAVNVSCLSKNI